MVKVLVIADDLTGCNATGALYGRLGFRAISTGRTEHIERLVASADVLAIDSGSRHYDAAKAYRAVRDIAATATEESLVVKRIDTTLRGNLGAELDGVLDALTTVFAPRRVRTVAVPAFPDAGRTTAGGLQFIDGRPVDRSDASNDPFAPVTESRIKTVLAQQMRRSIVEIHADTVGHGVQSLAEALRACDDDVIVCDAATNGQLRTIAAAVADLAAESEARWVVLDSGPFGAALAAELAMREQHITPGVVLAIVGSRTARTSEQLAHAQCATGMRWIDLDSEQLDQESAVRELLREAASGGQLLGVRATGADGLPERILACLAGIAVRGVEALQPAGLYASGGEVAACVTSALDADGFAIEEQLLPLAVAGRIVGGPHDGLPFATKGGLIGGIDATSICLEHLLATRVRHAIRRGAAPNGTPGESVQQQKEEAT